MTGIVIGVITFFLIGLFHPIVILAEYHFGKTKPIVFFIVAGIITLITAFYVKDLRISIIFGILSCCFFWSIKELKEQEERVLKGWFPENPKRHDYYEAIRKQNDK